MSIIKKIPSLVEYDEYYMERSSLYSKAERIEFRIKEVALVARAKQGDMDTLLTFWAEKMALFVKRTEERIYKKEALCAAFKQFNAA